MNLNATTVAESKILIGPSIPIADQPRAWKILENYGDAISIQVGSVMLYAQEKGKLKETFEKLEEYYGNTVHYQHPDARYSHPSNVNFFNELHTELGAEKLSESDRKSINL